ncbi:DsrE family protein [Draconibacterium sediminis]|uniref:DsrE family protein n=1 Tax=Draconibacterium sediminis TaxID=1544798 RepID=UPI0018DE3806|nr:DsrE family protein [Draconibacterium sediminis]
MKKLIFTLSLMLSLFSTHLSAQLNSQSSSNTPTSIGMVIYSNDVETVWNAFRLANYSKNQGDTVQVFLLGKGVEVDLLVNDNKDLKQQVDAFLEKGGEIQGCGTCLKSRKNDQPQVCTFSSLADLYTIIRKNKIVLTF